MKPEPKNTPKNVKQMVSDQFSTYAAIVVLLFFGVAGIFIYMGRDSRNEANLSYLELKKTYLNDQGMVGRLMVSVQVSAGNEGWLEDHKGALDELFQKEMTVIDLETLRNKEGMIELQDELRRKFNQVLKTDKIEAVMVTEVLLQDQRTE